MNWAVLYLILCTVRIYATFELFPPRMFENIHQSSEAMYTNKFYDIEETDESLDKQSN